MDAEGAKQRKTHATAQQMGRMQLWWIRLHVWPHVRRPGGTCQQRQAMLALWRGRHTWPPPSTPCCLPRPAHFCRAPVLSGSTRGLKRGTVCVWDPLQVFWGVVCALAKAWAKDWRPAGGSHSGQGGRCASMGRGRPGAARPAVARMGPLGPFTFKYIISTVDASAAACVQVCNRHWSQYKSCITSRSSASERWPAAVALPTSTRPLLPAPDIGGVVNGSAITTKGCSTTRSSRSRHCPRMLGSKPTVGASPVQSAIRTQHRVPTASGRSYVTPQLPKLSRRWWR